MKKGVLGLGIGVIVAAASTAASALHKKFHYDTEGYNRQGFDKDGYDREGYNKNGFDRFGYDKNGFDSDGFDQNGYDIMGVDRSEHTCMYYADKYKEIRECLNKAKTQMKREEFGYALHDIRIGLEKGVKCVIAHFKGDEYISDSLDENITFCKYNGLIEREFVEELYDAKNHCNELQHDSLVQKEYNQVYFAYKVLESFNKDIIFSFSSVSSSFKTSLSLVPSKTANSFKPILLFFSIIDNNSSRISISFR